MGLAIAAITLSIWDHVRVRFWEWYCPLKVRFDRRIVPEWGDRASRSPGEPTVLQIRFSVKNRVDYRAEILLGGAFWKSLSEYDEELRDQVTNEVLASIKRGGQLTASVEAAQSRHLVQRILLPGEGSGSIIPSVTFLVGRPGHTVQRVATWKRSIDVRWNGRRHDFKLVPTKRLPGSRRRDLVGR